MNVNSNSVAERTVASPVIGAAAELSDRLDSSVIIARYAELNRSGKGLGKFTSDLRPAFPLLTFVGLLASCNFNTAPTSENQMDRFQSVRLGDSDVIGLTMPRNITSQRMVSEARKICLGRNPCRVLGSYDASEIAMAMAQPEKQALIKEFRYISEGDEAHETVEVNCQYYPDAEPDWCSK